MKTVRILMMVLSILTLTTLSSAQTQTNSSTTKPKSSEASASGDQSNIIAREQQIIDAIRSRKQDVFQSLVDQNGWVMTPGGAQQVSSVMSQIFNPAMTFTEYRMEEPRVMMIDKNTAVLTYRSISAGTMNGKTESETSYDSTVWVKRKGKWMAIFHQSTPVTNPQGSTTSQE